MVSENDSLSSAYGMVYSEAIGTTPSSSIAILERGLALSSAQGFHCAYLPTTIPVYLRGMDDQWLRRAMRKLRNLSDRPRPDGYIPIAVARFLK